MASVVVEDVERRRQIASMGDERMRGREECDSFKLNRLVGDGCSKFGAGGERVRLMEWWMLKE